MISILQPQTLAQEEKCCHSLLTVAMPSQLHILIEAHALLATKKIQFFTGIPGWITVGFFCRIFLMRFVGSYAHIIASNSLLVSVI